MGNSKRQYIFLFFLLPAVILTKIFINFPDELEWKIFLFLCIMVVFDQLNLKTFSGFGYSFFNVILSLIIFDRFSLVYGFIYLLIDCLVTILMQKRGSLQSTISLVSMYVLIIIICNEFYNGYSEQTYLSRYLTLLLMIVLSMILKYAYIFLETGAMTSKLFLDRFGPMVFEVVIIFPILAFVNQLEVNLVLILFLSYYSIIGYMHKKFMGINQAYIEFMTKKINERFGVQLFFMDLNEVKGVCLTRKKMILIDEKLDFPEQLQTIIHELLHFKMRSYQLPKKIEEMIIILFEAAISWYYILTIKYDFE